MKALDGIKILDFTHVQSGPTCTQLLAWFGADVLKVERPGVGDATRKQLVDVPGADSLYFTMLNHNKRSIELNSKNEIGKEVLTRLIEECDVLVENFAPGALDRMGFSWERIQEINPRIIMASVKGFGPGKYEDCKVYENVAQCAGGAASTTGRVSWLSTAARPWPGMCFRTGSTPPVISPVATGTGRSAPGSVVSPATETGSRRTGRHAVPLSIRSNSPSTKLPPCPTAPIWLTGSET